MAFRRRRGSRGVGRREPMYWARACVQTFGQENGEDVALDCETSTAVFGTILFDPSSVAQFNTNESRVTVRSIRVAGDFSILTTAAGTSPDTSLWAIAIKTSQDASGLVGVGLQTLLDFQDVLGIWMIGGRTLASSGRSGGSLVQSSREYWDINVQRKLDVVDNVVLVFGFLTHNGTALLSTAAVFGSMNAVISVLWQRTLR